MPPRTATAAAAWVGVWPRGRVRPEALKRYGPTRMMSFDYKKKSFGEAQKDLFFWPQWRYLGTVG